MKAWKTWVLGLSVVLMARTVGTGSSFTYRAVPLFPEFTDSGTGPRSIVRPPGGPFYLLDASRARMRVVTDSGRLLWTIGPSLSPTERWRAPIGLAVDPRSRRVWVVDADAMAIYSLSPVGRLVGKIPLGLNTATIALAVNSRGELIVNQPRRGKLLSVYAPEGRRLREFGELMDMARAYPERGEDPRYASPRYRVPMSRTWVAVDGRDFIYVAFVYAPIVQKYDSGGNLVWTKRLDGPEVEALVWGFWERPREGRVMSTDGVQMRVICGDIAVDASADRVYVLLADGSIYGLAARTGERLMTMVERRDPRDSRRFPLSRLAASEGRLYGASWEGYYRLEVQERP